ncbi:MATE family efflux transporter [Aerophototrophica crusticola]|uniref:Multidrug-efflux transporter n=1 Tax=Aerophototrophica crusticola TaxID=1709002 RepID=A0A858R6P3_9PROT|nr:MATE family efflux transporter [Rhodospirillaceae bacterium B3]
MSAADLAQQSLAPRVSRHVRELVRLAVPVMVARAGQMTMVTVDTIVVGRYGAEALAHLGLAGNIQGTLLAILAGLLLGTSVKTAQAMGAGREEEAGAVWRRSIPYSLLLGLLTGLFCLAGEPLFLLTGQTPDLAAGGGSVMMVYAFGMGGAALLFTTSFFLEGIKRPLPGMVAILIANVVNIGLDWWLVFGGGPVPALGAEGSALATTIIRWAMALALILYVWRLPDHERFGIRKPVQGLWLGGRAQRQLGYAAGLSNGIEASAFTALGLFAGWLGALGVATFTIGLNLIALPFMMALGLASATAVRVGTAYGAGDRREAQLAGWTSLGVTVAVLGLLGLVFAVAPGSIAAVFTRDPDLVALSVPVVAFSAWLLVADGGQVVMAQALRGRNDAWIPTVLHFFSYFAVMMPVGWYLAFPLGRGVLGLFEGIFIASVVSVSILSVRFWWLGKR